MSLIHKLHKTALDISLIFIRNNVPNDISCIVFNFLEEDIKQQENKNYLTNKVKQFVNRDFHKYNKKVKIGAIIAFDQLPGKLAELYEINNNAYKKIYSKLAAEISSTFIYKNFEKNDDVNIREWYYILMPFVNINDKQNIQISLDFQFFKFQSIKLRAIKYIIYLYF